MFPFIVHLFIENLLIEFKGKALALSGYLNPPSVPVASLHKCSQTIRVTTFSDRGQRGIWRRLREAPPPCRTRRWCHLWGGCHMRPGCRCRWRSGRVTTCAGPTSRPQMTEWHQSALREYPEEETHDNDQYLIIIIFIDQRHVMNIWCFSLTYRRLCEISCV